MNGRLSKIPIATHDVSSYFRDKETVPGPKYPNQQLRSVSLETFFHGSLAAANRFADVQAANIERFPLLFVPLVEDGEPLAMRPYQLASEDRSQTLALAVNQATLVERNYPGHESFLPDASMLLASTLETLGVTELTRVIFRYDNAISLSRESDGTFPVHRVFNFGAPLLLNVGFADLDLTWSQPVDGGLLHVDMQLETRGQHGRLLANVAAEVKGGSPTELSALASAAHSHAVNAFESMITSDFRRLIEGEDL